jgi:hypothetical protein
MSNRHHPRTRLVESLRLTIDCLPIPTREAMLQGIDAHERIIVGGYVDGEGGVCPMLAAHQAGGRTAFLPFAKAWDRFTRAGRHTRLATRRELDILVGQLQASLLSEADIDLVRAIEEHRELLARREPAREPDPTGEIVVRALSSAPQPAVRGEATLGLTRDAALDVVAGPHEHDLGYDARGGDLQQIADGLGNVLRRDHLIGRDVLLDEVGHRSIDPARAKCR